ncbi:hypothetical protein DV738_g2429, partial [Chaetothyriales sp. CBS 135597]
MASATASTVAIALSLAVLCLTLLLLLRHFLPLRSTPAFLLLPVFLAVALPASTVLLVPIDLASTSGPRDDETVTSKGIWLARRPLLVAWRLVYWLTFVLTWFVLPILAEYMDSGHRDVKARLMYSLRSNARYQLIMLGCAVVGLIYLIIDYGFNPTAIKGLVMALAYVWGLVLAIYLAGHGMVALPRRLFRNANTSGRLRRVQTRAVKVHDQLDDAVMECDALEAQVLQLKQRKTGSALLFHDWIDELADMTAHGEARLWSNPATLDAAAQVPAVITERYLAHLTRRLERARHQRARYTQEWDRIVQSATDLQAILDSRASHKLDFGRGGRSILSPCTRYLVHVHILPAVRLTAGTVLALASVAVILSELIKLPAPQYTPVSLTIVHHPSAHDYQVGFGGQLMAAAWIAYMCICALSSVGDVPVWNGRALVKRNTHPEAACWYAAQIAKLTVPLAYNFLTFLPEEVQHQTVFYDFFGRFISLTRLGTWFNYLFPIFILLPVGASLFNLYGRIKTILGFELIGDDGNDGDGSGNGAAFGGWRDGRDLIAQDLAGIASSTSSSSTAASGSRHSAAVRLQDSPRQSFDRRPGPAPKWSSTSPAPAVAASRPRSGAARQVPPLDDPEPEQGYFTLLGRRIKNTVEAIETPKWMASPVPNKPPEIKRPKWMGGGASGSASRS